MTQGCFHALDAINYTLSVSLLDMDVVVLAGTVPSKGLAASCPQESLPRWRPELVNATRRPSSFPDVFLRLSHCPHIHWQLNSSFTLAASVVHQALDEIEEDIVDLTA
ncbi:hypothetical protein NEOLEDRAFT_1184776 [Neolentinus lepideus HHB14362 ss-1]|uniref:Uncharacterized protein n=1 Tax=Neolentinus lepideus HHB14362 ss-1 TaxID=1314782 RepID=A0A165M6D2_9AGAM|nr:hypothetical protein NEOLEDRAFT_1184776 [Neolentinus lepideus HHB14362 ss-1]